MNQAGSYMYVTLNRKSRVKTLVTLFYSGILLCVQPWFSFHFEGPSVSLYIQENRHRMCEFLTGRGRGMGVGRRKIDVLFSGVEHFNLGVPYPPLPLALIRASPSCPSSISKWLIGQKTISRYCPLFWAFNGFQFQFFIQVSSWKLLIINITRRIPTLVQ